MALRECNRENMKKFISALRSHKYAQATGALRVADSQGFFGYCCLGMAKEVAIENGVVVLSETNTHLPFEVAEWLGLGGAVNPRLSDAGEWRSATECNDARQYSFKKIADLFQDTYLPDADYYVY